MRPPSLSVSALALVLTSAAPAGAQFHPSYSTAPGSPTLTVPGPGCLPFAPAGDLMTVAIPPGALISAVPMGPAGCGLGWTAGVGNVDAFSSGLESLPAIPVGAGVLYFHLGVDGAATGFGGPALCAAPATLSPTLPPFPPGLGDIGSEACAQPASTDAAADVFQTFTSPVAMPPPAVTRNIGNFFALDGNCAPSTCPSTPAGAPCLALAEPGPLPGGDEVDTYDRRSPSTSWDSAPNDGIPDVPVYYSVDGPTAVLGGVLPGDVLVTMGGAPPAVYASAAALGLDAFGPPGSDDLDALEVRDKDGLPFAYSAAGGDVVLFSVRPGSAILGTGNPCAGPLAGLAIEPGDILTEGTPLGAPGAACILVPAENLGLWTFRSCGVNPVTGLAAGDDLDALGAFVLTPPPTPTATPTATATPTTTPTPTPTATAPCPAAPVAGCRTPSVSAKGSFAAKDKSPDDKDQLQWKWAKGSVTSKADFGLPTVSTSYQLCVYDGAPVLLYDSAIPAGGTCGLANPKPCWQEKPKGFTYKDKDLTPDGVAQLQLGEGLVAGKAKIQLKAKGSLLDDPTFGFAPPVTVQLHGNGLCWETVHSAPATKNQAGPPGDYKDKAD